MNPASSRWLHHLTQLRSFDQVDVSHQFPASRPRTIAGNCVGPTLLQEDVEKGDFFFFHFPSCLLLTHELRGIHVLQPCDEYMGEKLADYSSHLIHPVRVACLTDFEVFVFWALIQPDLMPEPNLKRYTSWSCSKYLSWIFNW